MAALIRDHNCPKEPFGEFMKSVTRLSEGGNNDFPKRRDKLEST